MVLLLKYQINMIKSFFTNDTSEKPDIETSDLRLSFKLLSFFENSLFKGNFEMDQVYLSVDYDSTISAIKFIF